MEENIKNLIYIIITGCGILIVKEILRLINKEIDSVQVETDIANYEKLNSYIDKAQEVIGNVVLSISQTYVETLKKNGAFTEDAQKEAKDKAIEMANQLISEESKNAIVLLHGDLNVYLDTMIESFVKQNKTN